MGAWIEIDEGESGAKYREGSHPSWVRGLKLSVIMLNFSIYVSHPSWVRGLKFIT